MILNIFFILFSFSKTVIPYSILTRPHGLSLIERLHCPFILAGNSRLLSVYMSIAFALPSGAWGLHAFGVVSDVQNSVVIITRSG